MSLHAGPTPGRPFGSSAPPSVCDVIGSAPPPAFKSRVSAEGVQSVGGSRSGSVVWGPPPVSVRRSSVCQVVVQKCGVSVRVKKPTVKFAALQVCGKKQKVKLPSSSGERGQ
ncbi:uncharacterized protein LOC112533472 isoform X2 [Gallus gallus]|uniref:uncharacterized protein LOC112533472 isoform X2 n=1 Tax=Gallus gallus TaxID=9031 RepID=UPI001AE3FB73|nr:uncharacterized protein LOC112533472 isoform X2 [Gallus gallus]